MSNDVIFISNARLSFPHLVEPQKQINDGVERISYNGELILAPNDPGFAAFMKKFSEKAVEAWKEHANAVIQMIHADRKSRCYGQGNEKVNKKNFQPYDGYANNVYITVGNRNRPQMIRPDGTAVDGANTMEYQALARKMYGGCRVNAAIKLWVQLANPAKKYGNGVRCDLVAIQFAGDDTPFGEGAVDASGLFGAVASAPSAQAPAAAMPLPPFMLGQ